MCHVLIRCHNDQLWHYNYVAVQKFYSCLSTDILLVRQFSRFSSRHWWSCSYYWCYIAVCVTESPKYRSTYNYSLVYRASRYSRQATSMVTPVRTPANQCTPSFISVYGAGKSWKPFCDSGNRGIKKDLACPAAASMDAVEYTANRDDDSVEWRLMSSYFGQLSVMCRRVSPVCEWPWPDHPRRFPSSVLDVIRTCITRRKTGDGRVVVVVRWRRLNGKLLVVEGVVGSVQEVKKLNSTTVGTAQKWTCINNEKQWRTYSGL